MKDKPKYLYHASPNRDIEVFEPREGAHRGLDEGPVVFATPNKIYVSMFLVKTDDSWAQFGFFSDVPYFICADRKRYMESDKGGAIYTLPSDSFASDPVHAGMVREEYTSKVAVRPVDKVEYNSGLQAMIDNNVNIYFVDKDTFTKMKKAEDHGWNIIKNLSPES